MELSLRLIEELALLFVAAAGLAYVLGRLRVPPVLGYLVAGVAVGPSLLGWVRQVEFVQALGDLGVVLIMFGLGLDFDLDRIRRRAGLVIVAGVGSVLVTFVAANAVAVLLGFQPLPALFLAAALSICGTAVNLRLLRDLGHLDREHGPTIAAVIVITDIAAVLLLTALSGVALGGGLRADLLALSLLKAAAFLVLAPAIGFLAVPPLLNGVARVTRSREVVLITTIALCLGLALVAQRLGFSLALGAFVMGMAVSEARVYHPIEEMTKPLEHVFGTVFFLSVGLSAEVGQAAGHWPLIVALIVVVTLARLVPIATATYLGGFNGVSAVASGWALVPIGEFSFVIVAEGVRFGVLPREALAIAVVVALATSALAAAGLATTRAVVARLQTRLPVGVLNLLTLLQLRTAAARAVPGLAEMREPAGAAPAAAGARADRRSPKRDVQDLLINAAFVVAIAVGLASLSDVLGPRLPPELDVRIVLAGVGLVLCAPSVGLIVRRGAALAALVSRALGERFGWVDARVMRVALLAGGGLGLLLFLQIVFLPLLLTRFRGYSAPVMVAGGALTLVVGYLLWRAIRDLQRQLTGLVRDGLVSRGAGRGEGRAQAPSAGVLRSRRRSKVSAEPYRAMIDHMTVPEGSAIAGSTLGESGLRERTGVTILGIERRGRWIGNPGADERVQAGDELVYIGSEGQREQAEKLVAESEAKTGPGRGGRSRS